MAVCLGTNQAEPGQLLLLPAAWWLALGSFPSAMSLSGLVSRCLWLGYDVFRAVTDASHDFDAETKTRIATSIQ